MSTASVPRLLSTDFPSSNFGGSGISQIAVSISSIISLSGFTATAVGELNNDDFEGGNNSGDWAFKNWFWVLKFWFSDGGWKLFKVGGSDDGGSDGGKKVDSGDEGGGDKRSLFPLVFFQVF